MRSYFGYFSFFKYFRALFCILKKKKCFNLFLSCKPYLRKPTLHVFLYLNRHPIFHLLVKLKYVCFSNFRAKLLANLLFPTPTQNLGPNLWKMYPNFEKKISAPCPELLRKGRQNILENTPSWKKKGKYRLRAALFFSNFFFLRGG